MDLKTYIATKPRGAASKLASEIEVSVSYLSQMASGAAALSPQRIVEIELATRGEVNRIDQFPDDWQKIWPELAKPRKPRKSAVA